MSTLSNARRPLATAHRLIHDGDAATFRGYIHSLYQTDGFGLTEAAELLQEYTYKQGVDFVKELCETATANKAGLSLVRFLTEHFFPRFPANADSRRLLQRVYLLYKNLAVAVYEALHSRESGELAYTACCRYADFQNASTSVGRLSVISARTRALEIMEALAQDSDDITLLMGLANAYGHMADSHRSSHDLKGARQAQMYTRKKLELSQKLYAQTPDFSTATLLAEAREQMADLLQGSILHKQAQGLYEQALELRKELADSQPTRETQRSYAFCCGKLADLHTETKGEGRRERAISLYQQEAELLKALSADTDHTLQQEYARCRLALGDLLADSEKVKDCITAFDHYKAAAALYLRAVSSLPAGNTVIQYGESRLRMAQTLWRVGGDNNLNTALTVLEELTVMQQEHPVLRALEGNIFFLTYALEDRLWIRHPLERQHPEYHPDYEHAYGCAEILEILSYLPQSHREKLSCKERTALRTDALPFYKKHIDPKVPLNRQELTQTAADWVKEFMKHVK